MEEFYTINQAAISLKVHSLTVRRYIKEGKLKAYRVGGNIRVSVNDLRAFLQSFVPQHKSIKLPANPQTPTTSKEFTSKDPLLFLKGKGLSI